MVNHTLKDGCRVCLVAEDCTPLSLLLNQYIHHHHQTETAKYGSKQKAAILHKYVIQQKSGVDLFANATFVCGIIVYYSN